MVLQKNEVKNSSLLCSRDLLGCQRGMSAASILLCQTGVGQPVTPSVIYPHLNTLPPLFMAEEFRRVMSSGVTQHILFIRDRADVRHKISYHSVTPFPL